MLRYKLRPITVTGDKEIKYKNLYIAPDLSYISGITNYITDLRDGDHVYLQNSHNGIVNYFTDAENVTINLEEVRIQGRVSVKMRLPVKVITKKLNLPISYDSDNNAYIIVNNTKTILTEEQVASMSAYTGYLTSVTQNYVEYNGNISYFFNGDTKGYLVNGRFYNASITDQTIDIEDYLYIENGKISVGDIKYDVIFDENRENPLIKLNKYSDPVSNGDVLGTIEDYECIVNTNDIIRYNSREYKFRIDNFYNDRHIGVEDVLRLGYKHYIEYNGQQLVLSMIDDTDGNQLGYGVMIDGVFHGISITTYENEYVSDSYYDYDLTMSYVEIDGIDYNVYSTPRAITDGGKNIFLITNSEILPIDVGSTLVAEGSFETSKIEFVQYDDDGTAYITHKHKRYDIEDHAFDVVIITNSEYRLIYEDDTYETAYIRVDNENKIYFSIDQENKKATQIKDIYYSNDDITIEYGKRQNAYDVNFYSGVTVEGMIYKINDAVVDENNNEVQKEYAEISVIPVYELNVFDIIGNATYLCNPIINDEDLSQEEIDEMAGQIVSDIVMNQGNFTFMLKSTAFGSVNAVPEASLLESMSTLQPMEITERSDAYKNIRITYQSSDLLVQFPMENHCANNLLKEDIISKIYASNVSGNFVNAVVDMEKDVYYPVYEVKHVGGCSNEFKDIDEIRFNLHFRTRNLNNWKILDDTSYDSGYTNWFITDYKVYKENTLGNRKGYNVSNYAKQNASDLVAFANFTTSEVRNMAKKISNSFLRVSLYSTNNPNTQVLLGTSCIYLDERNLLKKYMNGRYSSTSLQFINTELYDNNEDGWLTAATLANTELFGDMYLTDKNRLSTRLTVHDKYRTDASSEGFYQYIYKEYSRGMRQATIYARFEFNHAGVGQSIPFIIPRKNIGTNEELPLYLHDVNDLETLKQGFPMSDIYNQLYFPINIKYDDEKNRFVYWMPNNLRENSQLGVDNNIMEFNLFEIKFKDESF